MQVEPFVSLQPVLDVGVFVGGVVVQDQVDLQAAGDLGIDGLEEGQELKDSLQESEAAFEKELADVLMYALSICIDKQLDVETIINDKIKEVMQREY